MNDQVVLVTGGCGFIGTELCARLVTRGYQVTAFDNMSRGSAAGLAPAIRSSVEVVVGDVTDPETVRSVFARHRFDAVIHLAATHFIPDCDRDPVGCIRTNVLGTQVLLQECLEASSEPAFVLASSAAVYQPSSEPHTEASTLRPTDIYGLSKLWCEQLLELAHRQGGLAATTARLFNVYGEGETNPHLIPTLLGQARANPGRILVGNMETRRDYTYVGDVADALIAMIGERHPAAPRIFNVGTGSDLSGRELVEALAGVLGQQLTLVEDPARLRAVDRPRLLADPTGTLVGLGWRAATPLARGLERTLERPYAPSARVRS